MNYLYRWLVRFLPVWMAETIMVLVISLTLLLLIALSGAKNADIIYWDQ